ncbi:uncharacterized protein LOC143174630 [Nomia melanderi]|uniref:uncharacterized protein LOC143174630 n=1 Tax=Nomia melanderi TaxID=2448451 RepID=UPI003FCD5B08
MKKHPLANSDNYTVYISQFTTILCHIKEQENMVADNLSGVAEATIAVIDYDLIAEEQKNDDELKELREKTSHCPLKSYSLPSGKELWCDTSTENIRPFIPKRLQRYIETIKPSVTRHGMNVKIFVNKELKTCTHVFVRTDKVKKPLEPAYEGMFEVLNKREKYFLVQVKGKPVHVSIDRLKPAYLLAPNIQQQTTPLKRQTKTNQRKKCQVKDHRYLDQED